MRTPNLKFFDRLGIIIYNIIDGQLSTYLLLGRLVRSGGNMKAPRNQKDWEGKKVRLLVEATNGFVSIPRGTVLTIITAANTSRKSLRGERCPHCGIAPIVSISGPRREFLRMVEFLDEGSEIKAA